MGETPDISVLPDVSASYDTYFSRPQRIWVGSLSEGGSISTIIEPWSLYFSNAEVQKKISGFSRMRAKLHVKLIVNGSPYQYTLGLMSYKPLCTLPNAVNNGATFSGGSHVGVALGTLSAFMAHTQYPHAFWYPQTSKGCEMELPFVYPNDWVTLRTQSFAGNNLLSGMGCLCIQTMFPLTSAGTATANPVNISIYAWATDVELSGPSLVFTAGEVSSALSTSAKVVNSLSVVPVISPYARTIGSVLSGVSDIAKWFGFTNRPLQVPAPLMRVNYTASLTSPEVSMHVDKIALDPNNELNVDPVTAGFPAHDQMSFAYIQDRDVFIDSFTWAASSAYDTALWSAYVSPVAFIGAGGTGATTGRSYARIQMTPGALIAQHFQYWSGEVEYVFKVACSQFHRGRIRITYDPEYSGLVAPSFTGPTLHQVIWDISESDECRFVVPYMAPGPFLVCDTDPMTNAGGSGPWSAAAVPTSQYRPYQYNGLIQVSVLNELAVDSGTNAYIFAFINTKRCRYAAAKSLTPSGPVMTVVPLSGETSTMGPVVPDTTQVNDEAIPVKKTDTYMGESVLSVRTILHRPCLWDRLVPTVTPAACYYNRNLNAGNVAYNGNSLRYLMHKYLFPRLPMLPHVCAFPTAPLTNNSNADGSYPWSVIGNAAGTIKLRGIVCNTTPLSLWTACYTGWRGSIVWHGIKDTRFNNGSNLYNVTSLSMYPESSNWSKYLPSNTTGYPAIMGNIFNAMSGGHTTWMQAAGSASSDNTMLYNQMFKRVVGMSNDFGGLIKATPNEVPTFEGVFPHFSNSKFYPCNQLLYHSLVCGGNGYSDSWSRFGINSPSDCVAIETVVENNIETGIASVPISDVQSVLPTLSLFVNTGPDFSLFGFMAVPTIYRYTSWFTDNTVVPAMSGTNSQ